VYAFTLHPSDDTTVTFSKPGKTAGSKPIIKLTNPIGEGERQGFVRFDLLTLPENPTIQTASLKVWIGDIQGPGQLSVHLVAESWKEQTLNAKTTPWFFPAFTMLLINEDLKNHFIYFDVTREVQDWTTGTVPNYGFALTLEEGLSCVVKFDSKENSHTSHPMELEPQGLPGPQGPVGPEGMPGNLLLAGQLCPQGNFVQGFDQTGHIVCIALPNPDGDSPDTSPPPPPENGTVFITEIMADPSAVTDSKGEWFEIHNPSLTSIVDINGWIIKDRGSNTHIISHGGPLSIQGGGYLILGINSDLLTNGGVVVDYQYASFTLTNTEDEIVLVDTVGNEIDFVEYNASFPKKSGVAFSLNPLVGTEITNDVATNWCTAPNPFGDGDLGSPGLANPNCP
jgi:hypothetical protein